MTTQIKQDILELVRSVGGGVSFVELGRIEGFIGGDTMFYDAPAKNLILWLGISGDAIAAIGELLREGAIEMKRTSPFVYYIDGVMMRFPVARQTKGYKHPRWLPVVFNLAVKDGDV